MLDCYSPDAVYVAPSGIAEGHEEIAWHYEQYFKGFPDFHATAWLELAECAIPAVTEWTYTGTHTGPFLLPDGHVIEGTGHRITVRASCAAQAEVRALSTRARITATSFTNEYLVPERTRGKAVAPTGPPATTR